MDLAGVRVHGGKDLVLRQQESLGLPGLVVVEAVETSPDSVVAEYLVQLLGFGPRRWVDEVDRYSVDASHGSLVCAVERFGNHLERLVPRQ